MSSTERQEQWGDWEWQAPQVPSVTENLNIMLHLCNEVVGLPRDYPLPQLSLEEALEAHAAYYGISMELAREDYQRSLADFAWEIEEEIRLARNLMEHLKEKD